MAGKEERCALIAGAPKCDYEFIKENTDAASAFVICADSGYKKCLEAGIEPDLIIGDFDSSPEPKAGCEVIKLPVVKDDTDTFYAVKEAVKRGFKEIKIFNALGARFDHSMANIMCLGYCEEKGIKAEIVGEKNRIYIVSGKKQIEKVGYNYFSVFAFMGDAEGVSIRNAGYEVEDITLKQEDQFGVSNYFKEGKAQIEVKKGRLLIIESRD